MEQRNCYGGGERGRGGRGGGGAQRPVFRLNEPKKTGTGLARAWQIPTSLDRTIAITVWYAGTAQRNQSRDVYSH